MFIDRFNQFIISSYKKDSRFRWISNSFGLFHCSRLKQMPLLIVYGKLVTQKLVTDLPQIWRYRPVYYHWFICARIHVLQVLFIYIYIYKIRLYIFCKMGTLILLDVLKHWRIVRLRFSTRKDEKQCFYCHLFCDCHRLRASLFTDQALCKVNAGRASPRQARGKKTHVSFARLIFCLISA